MLLKSDEIRKKRNVAASLFDKRGRTGRINGPKNAACSRKKKKKRRSLLPVPSDKRKT